MLYPASDKMRKFRSKKGKKDTLRHNSTNCTKSTKNDILEKKIDRAKKKPKRKKRGVRERLLAPPFFLAFFGRFFKIRLPYKFKSKKAFCSSTNRAKKIDTFVRTKKSNKHLTYSKGFVKIVLPSPST